MFQIEAGPECRPGVERIVQARTQSSGPAIQPGAVRTVETFGVEQGINPQRRREPQASAHTRIDPIAVAQSMMARRSFDMRILTCGITASLVAGAQRKPDARYSNLSEDW